MDSISITGIEVFAHHGVFPHEQADGQMFLVDLELGVDLEPAGRSDELDRTVDYGDLAVRVHTLVATGPVRRLIETVASDVAELVLADERIATVKVTVHKPAAPHAVAVADTSVTIVRSR